VKHPKQDYKSTNEQLTAISFLQVQKSSIRVCCVFHNLLDFLLAQDSVLDTIMGFDDNYTDRPYAEEISNLKGVRSWGMLSISEQAASTRVARKGLGCRHNPEILGVRRNQQLTSAGIRKFVSLELPTNVHCVLGSKVNRISITAPVGPLNNDSL
jgi:hypothetical protein